MVAPWVVYWLAESDALTVKLKVPAAVGTPLTPPSEPSVRPPGSAPLSRTHVYGEAPPLAPRVAVYAMPTSPPAIGMPVMDAGVEAWVGLGAGVGVGLGVGLGVMLFFAAVTHVNPQSSTNTEMAATRVRALTEACMTSSAHKPSFFGERSVVQPDEFQAGACKICADAFAILGTSAWTHLFRRGYRRDPACCQFGGFPANSEPSVHDHRLWDVIDGDRVPDIWPQLRNPQGRRIVQPSAVRSGAHL